MKQITAFFLAAFFVVSCNSNKQERPAEIFYMPAEWEQHDAVWLGWEKDSLRGYYPAVVNIIKALAGNVTVKIAFNNDTLLQKAKAYLASQGVDSSMYKTYIMPGDRYWIRDHGAAFLVNGKGELGVADFAWNSYGYPGFLEEKYSGNKDSVDHYMNLRKEFRLKTAKVDSLMAAAEGATILKTDVKHEGGAIEVNGAGTLILCEATVLQRNPDLKKEYIETEFKRVLGVSNIIWVKKGLADDPQNFFRRIAPGYYGGGTGGHTDEFVRFANANTIMLAWVDEKEKDLNPINQMNYERMNENYNILKNAKDQDGKSFTIIKVPLPDLITKKIKAREKIDSLEVTFDVDMKSFVAAEAPAVGDGILRVPAGSYMNYLVTNKTVLLPTYTAHGSSREKEEQARKIFEEQFPGRKIVFIDAIMQNWSGGGIHCSTQQQPKKK
ncbi:agmatine deiminase family protein [Lacibacter sp.]|uniref:agmatine deiminase family protein n=1 Tax=Lacibacter sp. TaxID=1915409 RepID=UPI002B4B6015|nr:agmatine deiminase family protein [Lacibacter sp.]HLP36879.1 agmatine deiminase family protein [Lacibacter sp.]